jgi:hypothetical protein
MGYPNWLCELPQTTFPVGVSLNLFRSKTAFPGLVPQDPFVFHANFVVGLANKVMLMKKFLSREKRTRYNAKFTAAEILMFTSKELKYFVKRNLKR